MATMVQNAKKAPVTKEVTKADLKQAIDRLAAAVGKRLKVEEGSRGTKVVVLDGDRFRAPTSDCWDSVPLDTWDAGDTWDGSATPTVELFRGTI